MAIMLHDKFDSWQEFQDKLDGYCKETYQSFVKDDSKTVESVNKTPKRAFPRRAPVCFREYVMRPLREETRTERDGAYRPKTAASWRRLRCLTHIQTNKIYFDLEDHKCKKFY